MGPIPDRSRLVRCAIVGLLVLLVAGVVPSSPASQPGAGAPRAEPELSAPPARTDLGVAALATTTASFGDWSQEQGNGERTGFDPLERTITPSNATSLRLLWSVRLPSHALASPILVNGTVYVGATDGYLYALSAADGHQLWRSEVGGAAPFSQCRGLTGVGDTPAFWNGTVYVVGGNDSLFAVNATGGTVLWSTDLSNESAGLWKAHYSWAAPLLYNGSAYLGLASGCDTPLVSGQVARVALVGSNHSVADVFTTVPAVDDGAGIWRGPSVDPSTGTVYATTGNENVSCGCSEPLARVVMSLSSPGLALQGFWQNPNTGCDCDFGTSPIVARLPNGTVDVAAINKDGNAYVWVGAHLAKNGGTAATWSQLLGSTTRGRSDPAFNGTDLFLAGGATTLGNGTSCAGSVGDLPLTSLTASKSFRWHVCVPADVQAGVVEGAGVLYVLSVNTPTWDVGWLTALDAQTGATLAQFRMNQTSFSGAVIGDGRLLFTTMNGSTFSGAGYVDAYGLDLNASETTHPPSPSGSLNVSASATGGMPPYGCTWQFGDGGAPVTGCAPSHAFAASGTYNVTVVLTDAAGVSVGRYALVSVHLPPAIAIAAFGAGPSVVDVNASTLITVAASGGVPPLSYAYAGLPAGCVTANLSSLSCRPSSTGFFALEVTVRDSGGQEQNATAGLRVVTDPRIASFIAAPTAVTLGNATSFSVTATGGVPPYAFSYASLPPGCATADVSSLACLPTANGTWEVSVVVRDTQAESATGTTAFAVYNPSATIQPLVATLSVQPSPVVLGGPVALNVTANGGTAPYLFTYQNLPAPCVSTNRSSLTCVPAAVGNTTVVVNVIDAAGRSVQASGIISVVAPRAPASGPSGPSNAEITELVGGVILVAAVAGVLAWAIRRRRPSSPG